MIKNYLTYISTDCSLKQPDCLSMNGIVKEMAHREIGDLNALGDLRVILRKLAIS